MRIRLRTNPKEIVRAKFETTLATIAGYEREAISDVGSGTEYEAGAVLERIRHIKEALNVDIRGFAEDVEIQGRYQPPQTNVAQNGD